MRAGWACLLDAAQDVVARVPHHVRRKPRWHRPQVLPRRAASRVVSRTSGNGLLLGGLPQPPPFVDAVGGDAVFRPLLAARSRNVADVAVAIVATLRGRRGGWGLGGRQAKWGRWLRAFFSLPLRKGCTAQYSRECGKSWRAKSPVLPMKVMPSASSASPVSRSAAGPATSISDSLPSPCCSPTSATMSGSSAGASAAAAAAAAAAASASAANFPRRPAFLPFSLVDLELSAALRRLRADSKCSRSTI